MKDQGFDLREISNETEVTYLEIVWRRRTMRILSKFGMMILIGLAVAACSAGSDFGGPGGTGGGGGGDNTTPTLGITSVQKMGATAIPNPKAASKPSLTSKALPMKSRFAFGNGLAFAAPCAVDPTLFTTSFSVEGGKIWIKEAYAILDEVDFEVEPSAASPEIGPFALDLTHTDDNVGQAINLSVPAGNYTGVKFRIQRLEDAPAPILNVADPASFRSKLLDNASGRRPSLYIAGTLEATAGDSCKEFIFIADHRWEVRIPFRNAASGTTAVEAVFLFDLEKAFKSAMTASGATLQALIGEVGAGTNDNMGAQFLDGRTKDPDHGTPVAEAIAAAIPRSMKVFVQSAGSMDDNPKGTTLVDDSALRVSGDDNPSVSDLQ